MNGRKKRRKRKVTLITKSLSICPNCGKLGSHFAPPCLWDPGFYICTKKEDNLDG